MYPFDFKLSRPNSKVKEGLSSYTLREMSVFKELDHPNIIKLKEIIIREQIYLVFEYMNRDLKNMIDDLKTNEVLKPRIIKVQPIFLLHIHFKEFPSQGLSLFSEIKHFLSLIITRILLDSETQPSGSLRCG